MAMDQELKDFITLSMGSLATEVSRLSAVMERQSIQLREIETKSITRVAELQKDIDDIREDIKDLKQETRDVTESQKFKWKTLSEERAAEKKEQAKKDEEQAVVNQGMKTINKLLWIILGVLLSIGAPFVWSLIVNGGVKGLP